MAYKQPKYKIGEMVYLAYAGDDSYRGSLIIEKPQIINGMALTKKDRMVYYFENDNLMEIDESSIVGSRDELLEYITGWLSAPESKGTKSE